MLAGRNITDEARAAAGFFLERGVGTCVFKDGAAGSLVIDADGVVESTSAFTLENPSRLVLDLMGLSSESKQERIQVSSSHVERVRVGAHDACKPLVARLEANAHKPDGSLGGLGAHAHRGEAVDIQWREALAVVRKP